MRKGNIPSATPTRRRSLLQKLGFKKRISSSPSSQLQQADLQPFPIELPWDLFLEVFTFADSSTLASLSRVSYDFLVSTAPLLYRDVTLRSVREVELFFCDRKKAHEPSRIDFLLSLNTTRSLAIDIASSPSFDSSLTVYPDRTDSPTSLPIPIQTLQITRRYDQRFTLKPLLHHVLPHLDPLEVEFDEQDRPEWASSLWELDRVLPLSESWTRLQEMTIRGAYVILHPSSTSLPSTGVAASRRFRLDLGTLLCSFYPNPREFMLRFERELETRLGAKIDGEEMGELVMVVKDEEEREEAQEAVSRIGEKWRKLFSVEMERVSLASV